MKKDNKLSLQKFRIAKFDNLSSIFGGSTDCGGDGTKDRPLKPKCIKTSNEVVLEP